MTSNAITTHGALLNCSTWQELFYSQALSDLVLTFRQALALAKEGFFLLMELRKSFKNIKLSVIKNDFWFFSPGFKWKWARWRERRLDKKSNSFHFVLIIFFSTRHSDDSAEIRLLRMNGKLISSWFCYRITSWFQWGSSRTFDFNKLLTLIVSCSNHGYGTADGVMACRNGSREFESHRELGFFPLSSSLSSGIYLGRVALIRYLVELQHYWFSSKKRMLGSATSDTEGKVKITGLHLMTSQCK